MWFSEHSPARPPNTAHNVPKQLPQVDAAHLWAALENLLDGGVMAEPEMVEPSCIARLARNGWPAKAIAERLGTTMVVVAGALRDADTAEKGVDRNLIVRSRLR